MTLKNKLILALVLVIFLATRLYKIAEIPGSVYWDEASIGYNAYSIATDLKDEWGDKLPLHFRAFGEFKLPVYIYSVSLFVKAIGLNEYAVRLPAVFYTLGTLIVLYLLMKKITNNEIVSIISVFILGFSPWLFIFSRTGYEVTAGLFFFLLGTYLFLRFEENKYYLLASVISFFLAFYSYNSFRIIIPICIVALFAINFREFSKIRKYFLVLSISGAILLLSLIPIYKLYKYDAGGVRLTQVEVKNKADFVKNYFVHFSPQFLFLKGDTNPRSQVPGRGQLYTFEIPFILLGLLAILKSKKILYFLPLVALILAPIPASLTRESPHALRAILGAPAFAMMSAIGINFLMEKMTKYKIAILILVVVGYSLSFESYFSDFVLNYNDKTKSAWQIEYKEIFTNQKSGLVTDRYAQPYIFTLYYQKYPPEKFRSEVKLNPVSDWGFSKVSSFGEYQFIK